MPVKRDVSPARWEHFPHGADVGICGRGTSLAEAFEQAAYALTFIVTDAEIADQASVEVSCDAPDVEVLLVEWLNAIIYEMAVRNMIFGRYKVIIEDTNLKGKMWGEPVDQTRHAPACEPKGATYTALRVAREADGAWSAACVIDV
jgi:SHS2 domain-containing protein